MDFLRRLIFSSFAFSVVLVVCFLVSRCVFARTVEASQGAAYSACVANAQLHSLTSCSVLSYGGGASADPGCSTQYESNDDYGVVLSNGTTYDDAGYGFGWCVPATCTAHDSGDPEQQWGAVYENGILYCNDSCMSIFHMETGIGSLQYANGDGGSWGHFVGNGNRCTSPIDASFFKPKGAPPPLCDHGGASCYNPQRGFCATTESGEQVCEPAPPPGSGGCAAGATGASCVGNGTPPPVPPDPPIAKGTPPDSSTTASGTDSGGTTNNYTTNNYSGTSPGGTGSGTPSGASSSGGGSQSNSSGSGNGPGPNGSAGTDSNGKCADGSVPTASGCSGTFTDSGCDTPPQCFGDAVMCGNAKENWATRCAVQKMAGASGSSSSTDYLSQVPGALGGAGVPSDGGASTDPSASGLVSSSDVGEGGFDTSGLGFGATCPASPTFSFRGHTFTLDLTPFCSFLTMFGWLLLLISFLVGLRIVATGKG